MNDQYLKVWSAVVQSTFTDLKKAVNFLNKKTDKQKDAKGTRAKAIHTINGCLSFLFCNSYIVRGGIPVVEILDTVGGSANIRKAIRAWFKNEKTKYGRLVYESIVDKTLRIKAI